MLIKNIVASTLLLGSAGFASEVSAYASQKETRIEARQEERKALRIEERQAARKAERVQARQEARKTARVQARQAAQQLTAEEERAIIDAERALQQAEEKAKQAAQQAAIETERTQQQAVKEAKRAAIEAERALQQAAEEAKQVAQQAAILAERESILAENAAQTAAIALIAAQEETALAQAAANEAAVTEAEVSIIEAAVITATEAAVQAQVQANIALTQLAIAQTAAITAVTSAQEAAAAVLITQEAGDPNAIRSATEAATSAATSAETATTAASSAEQSVLVATQAVEIANAAITAIEQSLFDATYTGTDVADFDLSIWEIEGFDPIVNNSMVFDALAAQHITSSGSGWRHEFKIESNERVAMTQSYEDFQANVKVLMSPGSKTIVSQFHASDTGTIMKLYISDSSESGFDNSIANDGIFDVYVRLLNVDGSGEQKKALGTIQSGDNFDFRVINDHGFVTVSAMGESFSLQIEDSPASYLKFGNYLQAQDAVTRISLKDSDLFGQFYEDANITLSELTFTNLSYVREVDEVVVIPDPIGQSVAITDISDTTSGRVRLKLDSALPQGKVSVNVKYNLNETETTYLTLFGTSTSSSNAIADLKMDSGFSQINGNVGIKLRSTDALIADYVAGEWTNISVSWDNIETNQFTVSINGNEVGTYDMNFIADVETIELKLGSNAKTSEHTFYIDDLNVFSDIDGTINIFADDYENIAVNTDLSDFGDNYSSSTTSAIITDVANADGYTGPVVEAVPAPSQSISITDTTTDDSGKLRLKLDEALPTGKVSIKVKYNALEKETAYLTLFGSSTSTSAAVADLKMDSGFSDIDGNVGIRLRSTDALIAEYAADEWTTITVAWDNVTTHEITVTVNGVEVGSYAMFNNADVEKIELKLGSNSNITDYTLYADDLTVYSDVAGSELVFFDDFEAFVVDTNLSGFGEYYDSKTNSAVVNDIDNATVLIDETVDDNSTDGETTNEEVDTAGQSVAITDITVDNAGKLRLDLANAMPTGQVSVKVKYNALETETAYLTLFGSSTSTSQAIADLKMDSGFSTTDGYVGIKLRSTDDFIAEYAADEWTTITVAWDNITTNEITVTINGVEIGSYAMFNNGDVEKIEVKLGSNANTTDYTLFVDDLTVYSDTAGTDLVFTDSFEETAIDTNLSGYEDYNSSTNSAVISDADNATGEEIINTSDVNNSAAITDIATNSSGRLRLKLDSPMSIGKASVNIKYTAQESETAYFTLYGSSTSTSAAVADLKMDSGYSDIDTNVGIRLRSTDSWIADYTADEWTTISMEWDNVTNHEMTVTINDVVIGTYPLFNSIDVENIEFKLGNNSNVSDYILLVDDLTVHSDTAGTALVFSDDFESTAVGTNLSGYNNYSSSTNSTSVTDQDTSVIDNTIVEEESSDTVYEFIDVSPQLAPSDNFNLTQWNISVPTDLDGNGKADTIKEDELNEGYEDHYFNSAADGGMTFTAYVDGYKTSTGTSYTRSELREMLRAGDTSIDTQGVTRNNWVFSTAPEYQQEQAGGINGNMTATLTVNHVTSTGDAYQQGRVIVGQIHAAVDEPIRLYYRLLPGHTKGSIYFAHEPSNGNDEQWYEMIGSRSDSADEPEDGIELNEVFSYEIDVVGNDMTVRLIREGKETITQLVDMTDSGYDGFYIDSDGITQEDYMYFKAGVYNQNNSGDGDDYVQATFYSLGHTHNKGPSID